MPDSGSEPLITVSIVSHGQNALVNTLCADLRALGRSGLRVILTENIRDVVALESPASALEIVENARPKGFGANHNAAFSRCATPYFCVCNPDIRLSLDPFPLLIEALDKPPTAAAGPLVRNPVGAVEDSARRFPTASVLLRKLLHEARSPDYPVGEGGIEVDWIAGMFMLFRSDAFRTLGGFDERYYLYYEDVDLCRRLRAAGRTVIFQPRAAVVHDARRGSRRQPALMLHHVASALRFLLADKRRR